MQPDPHTPQPTPYAPAHGATNHGHPPHGAYPPPHGAYPPPPPPHAAAAHFDARAARSRRIKIIVIAVLAFMAFNTIMGVLILRPLMLSSLETMHRSKASLGRLEERAAQTFRACGPPSDDSTCAEVTGWGDDPAAVDELQAKLERLTKKRGAFVSLRSASSCRTTSNGIGVSEVLARVELETSTEAVLFRWAGIDDDLRLTHVFVGAVDTTCG